MNGRCKELRVISVKTGKKVRLQYTLEEMVGVGTFGRVYRVRTSEGSVLAFKEQKHTTRVRFREITMAGLMTHQNLVQLLYYKLKKNKFCLMFMDYMPSSLAQLIRKHVKADEQIPLLKQKLFMFQLLRGLAFMHRRNIAHRDIKPDNIVIDEDSTELKICDFGSAKKIVNGSNNQSYICSRWYRAPELLMGANDYTVKIDIWSAGCVLAELIKLEVCFEGSDSLDQLQSFFSVLGPPCDNDLSELRMAYDFDIPAEPSSSGKLSLTNIKDLQSHRFLFRLLQYAPSRRVSAWDALFDSYFSSLRTNPELPCGQKIPSLYDWTLEEERIIPEESC